MGDRTQGITEMTPTLTDAEAVQAVVEHLEEDHVDGE